MYDSSLNKGFAEHKLDNTTQVFRSSKKVLFFSDVKNDFTHVYIDTEDRNKYSKHSLHVIRKYIEQNLIPIAQ